MNSTERKDVYTRVTDKIISDLERGIRTWLKPWKAEHTAGKISRPLRHNGTPYQGMNILLLWGEAMEKGYTAVSALKKDKDGVWRGTAMKDSKSVAIASSRPRSPWRSVMTIRRSVGQAWRTALALSYCS